MGEILGLGVTHYPPLLGHDEDMASILTRTLESGRVPPAWRRPEAWPTVMQQEWADDRGKRAAREHRRRLVEAFRVVRRELDAFAPDFIVIWGDDQYENFREDCVCPFCVFAAPQMDSWPFRGSDAQSANVWGERSDTMIRVTGHPAGAKQLCALLLEEGFDVAYAYALRYELGLAHAFINTVLFLDYDRRGFPHPVVPFHVNCYGSSLITTRGGVEIGAGEDPPGPSPTRCFNLGAATARALRRTPWRVALLASSSWSHAFLTRKNHWLFPDFDSDRARLAELRDGRLGRWRDLTRADFEDAGQHEMLNWVCLAGAMHELGREAEVIDWVESYAFNSNKCFAVFRP